MPLSTDYISKTPNADGIYNYTEEENSVWRDLCDRQAQFLCDHACQAFNQGFAALDLGSGEVPQVKKINARLGEISGAGVKGVDALIPQEEFSTLLSLRKFPVATFIRRREHLDYIEEPDIFHEVFGHCPMLTDPEFCKFIERFGDLALSLDEELLPHLFRLFWFTVEFGLIREDGKLKAFGAGIISSPSEAIHSVSDTPTLAPFDLEHALRTPYRIDILQPIFFVLDSFEQLVESLDADIEAAIRDAMKQGDLPAMFETAA